MCIRDSNRAYLVKVTICKYKSFNYFTFLYPYIFSDHWKKWNFCLNYIYMSRVINYLGCWILQQGLSSAAHSFWRRSQILWIDMSRENYYDIDGLSRGFTWEEKALTFIQNVVLWKHDEINGQWKMYEQSSFRTVLENRSFLGDKTSTN